jgi:hypothetical protein
MFSALAISGLTLIIGLISLLHDARGSRRTAVALGMSLFILFGLESAANIQSEREKEQVTQEKKLAEAETSKYRSAMLTLVEQLENRTQQVVTEVVSIRDLLVDQLGFSEERAAQATPEDIGQSLRAAETIQEEILTVTTEDQVRRQAIELQYFAKGFDGDIVSDTLVQLGFMPRTFTPRFPEIPTNAIWKTESVPTEDVKAIALALISAGVELKSVRTFRSTSPNSGRNLIQVGSDAELYRDQTCKSLTYEQIQSIQQIDRNTLVCGN